MVNIDKFLHETISKVASLEKEMQGNIGCDFLDNYSIARKISLNQKMKNWDWGSNYTIYFGANLNCIKSDFNNGNSQILNQNFLDGELEDQPSKCIYFLLNNDISASFDRYKKLYDSRPCSLFIVWDWDSQHWLEMSCWASAYSDFYIPVSSQYVYIYSHFNPLIFQPYCVGVNQWSSDFLTDNTDIILGSRVNEPAGPHVYYDPYLRRNRAIATLNKSFSEIKFSDNAYKNKNLEELLIDWAKHKVHWIIPVLSGIPIRVYNSLITGGIPIVPSFYRCLLEAKELTDDVIYYDVLDLIDPIRINNLAIEKFDKMGKKGVIDRFNRSLSSFHIDARCSQIIEEVKNLSRLNR